MTPIPNTALTERLRTIWEATRQAAPDTPPFPQWYAQSCQGGTPNGRAIAAVLFDRARKHWPDFFSPADQPALAVWGDIFDQHPFVTPDVIERAVDDVAATGVRPCGPAHFVKAAEKIIRRSA